MSITTGCPVHTASNLDNFHTKLDAKARWERHFKYGTIGTPWVAGAADSGIPELATPRRTELVPKSNPIFGPADKKF